MNHPLIRAVEITGRSGPLICAVRSPVGSPVYCPVRSPVDLATDVPRDQRSGDAVRFTARIRRTSGRAANPVNRPLSRGADSSRQFTGSPVDLSTACRADARAPPAVLFLVSIGRMAIQWVSHGAHQGIHRVPGQPCIARFTAQITYPVNCSCTVAL